MPSKLSSQPPSTVKFAEFDVPPPGGGLKTVIGTVPTTEVSSTGINTKSLVVLSKVVGRLLPFHCTTELGTKFEPSTVRVTFAVPTPTNVGEIELNCGTELEMLTEADAFTAESRMLVAVTVTGSADGWTAGAVYRPAGVIVPAVIFPPATPFTDQRTSAASGSFVVAVNCTLSPVASRADVGETDITIRGPGGGPAEPQPSRARSGLQMERKNSVLSSQMRIGRMVLCLRALLVDGPAPAFAENPTGPYEAIRNRIERPREQLDRFDAP